MARDNSAPIHPRNWHRRVSAYFAQIDDPSSVPLVEIEVEAEPVDIYIAESERQASAGARA